MTLFIKCISFNPASIIINPILSLRKQTECEWFVRTAQPTCAGGGTEGMQQASSTVVLTLNMCFKGKKYNI